MISSCLYALLHFWVAFDTARHISAKTKILIHIFSFFFQKQCFINLLIIDFSCACGMEVFKVDKSNVLMVLQKL